MPMMPRATSRPEMRAQQSGEGPQGGERLVEYNIFLTDFFKGSAFKEQFFEIPGQSTGLIENDDSYRQSRHLLRSRRFSDNPRLNFNQLAENSLARQLESKPERVATIRLIRRLNAAEKAQAKTTENHLPWVNLIPPNTKFFLEQVQESREEKVQVIDTFGEWIAFFFGRKPEVYSYSGTLLNAKNHDWKNEFQLNYDLFLRGTQAVRYRATVMLQYDDVLVEGYILNNSIQMNAVAENAVPFQFNMLVINRSPINAADIIGARLDRSGGTLLEQALFQNMSDALDLSRAGTLDELETFFLMREYFSGHYIPGAGTTVQRAEAGNVESETSLIPGQKGGLNNEKPKSSPVNLVTTEKLGGASVNGGPFGDFGISSPTLEF